MGIRGLSTYISENSDLFLTPFKLCDTYLIVDGNNIAHRLFMNYSQSCSIFGGDYDEYYETVKKFFIGLLKCNVEPIVLIDGGHEKKKIGTVLRRAKDKIFIFRTSKENYIKGKCIPILMQSVFLAVLEDLKIFYALSDFEADVEIASAAKALNCPVLSFDSDFYIYDVLYIPFSSDFSDPVKEEICDKKNKYFINCFLYDVNNLLNEFNGLDKSLLPILVTVLGNDYFNSSLFQNFFNYIILKKDSAKSYTQKKIHGFLHWLKKETFESAKKNILNHIRLKHANELLHAINLAVKTYTEISLSSGIYSLIDKLLKSKNSFDQKFIVKRNSPFSLPDVTISLFYTKGLISPLLLDIMFLGVYFTPIQIENFAAESSHYISLPLIKAIYGILYHYRICKSDSCKVYWATRYNYTPIIIDNNFPEYLQDFNLHYALKRSKTAKLKLFYEIINFDETDIKAVSTFNDPSWSIFVIGYIYWIKSLKSQVSHSHNHALLLMAVCNQVVQREVGYYRNVSSFMRKNNNQLNKLKNSHVNVQMALTDISDFKTLLNKVTHYECLLVQKAVIPMRHTNRDLTKLSIVPDIHLFSCFQSCLFHIIQINALLNFPFPHLKMQGFYSGTLLYNFFLNVQKCITVEKFGLNLLNSTPNLKEIYFYLCDNLAIYLPKKNSKHIKKRKRKKKKKLNEDFEVVDLKKSYDSDETDYECEYNDNENPYFSLKI